MKCISSTSPADNVLSGDSNTQPRSASRRRRYVRLATAAAFASLFSYAIVLLITQSLNNQVQAYYEISLGRLGWLAAAMMLGFFPAVLVVAHYSDVIGKLPLLLTGGLSMGVGALMFASAPTFEVALVATLAMGVGGGFSEGSATALVSDLYVGSGRSSMMNLAQAAFGVGAVIVPVATGSLLKLGIDWRVAYVVTAGLCFLSGVLALLAILQRVEKPLAAHGETGWRRVLFDPLVVMLSIGILLYVGAELGQSNWTSVYFRRELHAPAWAAAMSVSSLWVGIMVGRMLAALILKYLSDWTVLCWSLGLGAVAESALLLMGSPVTGLVAAFALGVFLGPVWPTIVSLAGDAFPARTGLVTGIVVSVGSVGAAVFPPVIGRAADSFGVRQALWICVFVLITDFLLFLRLRAHRNRHAEPNAKD